MVWLAWKSLLAPVVSVHEHFFGDTTTKQHADLVEHVLAVIAVWFWSSKASSSFQGSEFTGNDGDLVHGSPWAKNLPITARPAQAKQTFSLA